MCAEMACIYSFTMMGGKAPIDDANGPFRAGLGFFPCWERILIAKATSTLVLGKGIACLLCLFAQKAAIDDTLLVCMSILERKKRACSNHFHQSSFIPIHLLKLPSRFWPSQTPIHTSMPMPDTSNTNNQFYLLRMPIPQHLLLQLRHNRTALLDIRPRARRSIHLLPEGLEIGAWRKTQRVRALGAEGDGGCWA